MPSPEWGEHEILDAVSRRRIVPAVAAAALAATLLAGCQTNVGSAARVDGTRISESDVNQYVDPKGVPADVQSQAASQNVRVAPRSTVLSFLIMEQVFSKTLERNNIRVTDGELAALHDEAGSQLLQAQLSGSSLDSRLEKALSRFAIKPAFAARVLRTRELELVLEQKKNVASQSALVALLKPVASRVSVTPRYGTWDAQQLALNNEPVLPSFVTEQRVPGAGA